MYDLIIIGGGPAGNSAATHAARLGAELVESRDAFAARLELQDADLAKLRAQVRVGLCMRVCVWGGGGRSGFGARRACRAKTGPCTHTQTSHAAIILLSLSRPSSPPLPRRPAARRAAAATARAGSAACLGPSGYQTCGRHTLQDG